MFKKPKLESFKHIAVIQTAYLGDIVLSFYLLQTLRDLLPDVKLSFITTKQGSEIAQVVSCINELIVFDKRGIHKTGRGLRRLANVINQRKVDCVISLHKSYRTSKLVTKIKAKYKVGFDKAAFGFLVYNFRQKYHISLTEIQRNHSLLNAFDLNLNDVSEKVNISFSEKIHLEVQNLLPNDFIGSDLIVIAPGSVWATKRWLPEYFGETIRQLISNGKKCVLIGSEADIGICKGIEEKLKYWDSDLTEASLINLSGETNLLQLLYLMSFSHVVLTNDSAPTHLSELVGTPVATIFGPTSPIFGFAPHLPKSESIELMTLSCKPCEIHGGDKCPIKTHDCMRLLTPEIVFDIIKEMDI